MGGGGGEEDEDNEGSGDEQKSTGVLEDSGDGAGRSGGLGIVCFNLRVARRGCRVRGRRGYDRRAVVVTLVRTLDEPNTGFSKPGENLGIIFSS